VRTNLICGDPLPRALGLLTFAKLQEWLTTFSLARPEAISLISSVKHREIRNPFCGEEWIDDGFPKRKSA